MLDDWGDISPGAVSFAEDVAPPGAYSPAIVGPDAAPSTGEMPNAIKGRLRVGVLSDYIVLDPFSPLRMSMYAGNSEQLRIGNLNGFLGYYSDVYGIAIGNASSYLKYAGGTLQTSGAIQGGTIDIGGADASSFHVDSGGNLWLGAVSFREAPFRVSPAGDLVASSAIIGGVMTGQMIGEVNALTGHSVNVTLGKTDVVSGTLTLQLAEGKGDTYINSGKTDFTNVDSGFILGIDDSDSNTPKFYIGSATKHLSWDGTNLESTGMTLAGATLASTSADAFTVNSDLQDVNADLVFGRTTGGSATLRWNGTLGSFDKSICLLMGLHVGGSSDPGDNNLLVDGTGTITGAFGCNAASAQTAYSSGGALAAYGAGANGFDSGANAAALHAMVVKIRAALVANGIMS